jgi:hypothetical protein
MLSDVGQFRRSSDAGHSSARSAAPYAAIVLPVANTVDTSLKG